jgi:multicomponent Na+:H+ antiporter subunit F
MSVSVSELVATSAQLALSILTLSMLLVIYRIVRGPRQADRVIGLDLLSVLLVAMVALYAIFSGNAIYLDVTIAYALVAFLGTVAFARYIERSENSSSADSTNPSKGEDHD